MANFAERLRALRTAKGLSQQDLAKQIRTVSKSSINMYERGEREPNLETLEAIADYFNVDIDYLMGKSDIANSSRDWPPEYEDLLRKLVEERVAGREGAREAMIQTHGKDHSTHSLHVVDGKFAFLYYHAFDDRRQLGAVSSMTDIIEQATPEYAEQLRLMVEGYNKASDHMRQMVDLALDPFITDDMRDDGFSLDTLVPGYRPEFRKIIRTGEFDNLVVYNQSSAAGLGNYLDVPDSSREQYPTGCVPVGTSYGVLISGDSMEPEIHGGSTAFVQETTAVDPGEIGIFVLNGQAYCKQLVVDHERREVRLHSLNRSYDDIVINEGDEFRTLGRVLGSYPQ